MTQLQVERPIRLFAPAKINLGLEITGRRADGYHEIVTIMQAVSLFDVIELHPAERFSFSGSANVDSRQDLGLRAIHLFEERFGAEMLAHVRIEKHIPVAAGLGGGSSDAGTLLTALAMLGGIDLADAEHLAADLGSDVPFFIHGGTALATGTGTTLSPLPSPARTWFVIVTPDVDIPNKTARLYGSLLPEDFTDGESTRAIVGDSERGNLLNLPALPNSFSRPLYEIPAIDQARATMLDLGARFVTPCGAGPSLFTSVDRWEDARDLTRRLNQAGLRAMPCTTVSPDLNLERLT